MGTGRGYFWFDPWLFLASYGSVHMGKMLNPLPLLVSKQVIPCIVASTGRSVNIRL